MASSIQIEPRFQCILTNDSETEPDNTEPLYFKQEEGKKSSFLLNLDDGATIISKPAHVVITCVPQDKFLFGGLELVSNARNVEIYLTDQDEKEAYLTTCRGIVAGDDAIANNTFKCLVVCPGGPRPVLRVRLKLLSLKPESCTGASLHLIKLKGRLPPPKEPQQEATTDSSLAMSRQAPPPPTNNTPASPALTQRDMGAAMAGVSMLVRSVESSLLQSVQASLDRMEKKFDARFDRIEQYLMLQQQQALIQQQQQQERYNTLQSQQMVQMKEQQNELVSLIGSLQAQLHNQPLDEETHATTDKVDKEVQSESIKESRIVEEDDKVNDEQVVSEEKVSKSTLVSREESGDPELATDKAHDSWESTEQEDKVDKAESGALLDIKEKGGLEHESCADKESSEDKRFENAASTDSNDEVDERKNNNTEKAKALTTYNLNASDIKCDQGADLPVQTDDVPIDEEIEGSDEAESGDQSDETPGEGEQSSTNEIDVISVSEDTPKSATNSSISSQSDKQPIMNQRADAWEIPDLLSDTTVNEATVAVPASLVSIKQQAQDEVS